MKRTLRRIIVGVVAVLLMARLASRRRLGMERNHIEHDGWPDPTLNPFMGPLRSDHPNGGVLAVNAITRNYHPYLGTITAPQGASAEPWLLPRQRVKLLSEQCG
jgi:hypothetical protein